MYGQTTFGIWFQLLTRNASLNGLCLSGNAPSCPDLFAEAYWDHTQPTVAAMTRWNCGDDSWLTGEELEIQHAQKLKRGSSRGEYQVAA